MADVGYNGAMADDDTGISQDVPSHHHTHKKSRTKRTRNPSNITDDRSGPGAVAEGGKLKLRLKVGGTFLNLSDASLDDRPSGHARYGSATHVPSWNKADARASQRSTEGYSDADAEEEEYGGEEEDADLEGSEGEDDLSSLNEESESVPKTKKKIKPTNLTARQRALQGEANGSTLVEFPEGLVDKKKEMTEERTEAQIAKRQEAARKRRLMQEKQMKADQENTIEKILGSLSKDKKKKKAVDEVDEEQEPELATNTIRFLQRAPEKGGSLVLLTEDVDLPEVLRQPPVSCSSTQLPLCSLACYRSVKSSLPMSEAMAQ